MSVATEEMECAMSRKEWIYRRQKKRLKTYGPVFDKYLTNNCKSKKGESAQAGQQEVEMNLGFSSQDIFGAVMETDKLDIY